MSWEPGWYHAQGDPPNTVRRWNGEQWIGYAISRPTNDPAAPSALGVKPFERIHGHVSLSGLSVAATGGLALLIGAHGFLGYTVWQHSRHETRLALNPLELAPTPIPTAFTVVAVVGLLAGLLFIAWFATAYRNLSRWHHTKRSAGWAPFVFFVPFVQYRWPWDMMMELIESSARKEEQGDISPLAVMGWWGSWTGHQSCFLASIGLSQWTERGASSYTLAMLGSAIAIVGLCFAIFLVNKISKEQDRRRRPSAAQLALAGV